MQPNQDDRKLTELTSLRQTGQLRPAYGAVFWLAYLSNGLTTLANGMLVRYSDFVAVIGGDEQQLGMIVGVGMVGSILIRLGLGETIDRCGAWRVWRWSVTLYAVSLLIHLWLTDAYSPSVFFARAVMQASLAGVFGSSITFVSLRVPPRRMAEIIGLLGTSGFLGLMLGPLVSDWLAAGGVAEDVMVARMFTTAALLAVGSVLVTWLATRGSVAPERRPRPSLLKVMAQYHPMMISLTAMAMGAGFAIPMTFLRPFAAEMGFPGVGIFFVVYAVTGFAARLATRSLFERHGNRPWIIVGLILLSVSFVCYVPVQRDWQLIFPAAIAGTAHALLFPSIISAGTSVFPRQYLGVATSLILAMFDLGMLVSAPIVGVFLRSGRQLTSDTYPWMFTGAAIALAMITMLFWLSGEGSRSASNSSDGAGDFPSDVLSGTQPSKHEATASALSD